MTKYNSGKQGNQLITAVEEIDKNVFILSFERRFDFFPGQIIALSLDKDDPAPRLYSICSGTGDDEIKVLFNIVPGGKLTGLMSKLTKGDTIYSSNPYGRFHIKDEPSVWIASGTGIAPFVSRILSGCTAPLTLIHGGRHEGSYYFKKLIESNKHIEYIKCSSSIDKNGYYPGRVTKYLSGLNSLPQERRYYLCGNTEMVVESRDILISKGINYNMIESEIYF